MCTVAAVCCSQPGSLVGASLTLWGRGVEWPGVAELSCPPSAAIMSLCTSMLVRAFSCRRFPDATETCLLSEDCFALDGGPAPYVICQAFLLAEAGFRAEADLQVEGASEAADACL